MNIEYLQNESIAVVTSNEKIIIDTQSALDLAMSVKYETGTNKIAIDKNAVCDDFFILSKGIAGEILQKHFARCMGVRRVNMERRKDKK